MKGSALLKLPFFLFVERNKLLPTPQYTSKWKVITMDLEEVKWKDTYWIHLAQDINQRHAL
jgi:hypothetical protein